jgi:hypothetical protein
MNNIALGIVALAAAGAGAVGALALSDVLTPKYGIIVRATDADISPEKWSAIEAVLAKPSITADADPRIQLYRIRTFKDGIAQGNNDDGEMVETLLLQDRRVPPNFTGHAFQIGVGAIQRKKNVPKNGPDMPQAHFHQNLSESKEMVKEVDAVLDAN